MADSNKTVATDGDVSAFLAAVADERRRRDAHTLTQLMAEVTGEAPVLWGTAIVGFGERHYRYPSGREGSIAAVSLTALDQLKSSIVMENCGAGLRAMIAGAIPTPMVAKPKVLVNVLRFIMQILSLDTSPKRVSKYC